MTAPIIYVAHPLTGEYLGSGRADPDPLDTDNWLVPAHASLDAPPVVPAGQAAVLAVEGWVLQPDHRGLVYRTDTGALEQYTQFGELPEGLTAEARPSAFHVWAGGGWSLDEAAKLKAEQESERGWRDGQLNGLFELRDRHRDEVDLGIATALTAEQFAELLAYIQRLREWPQSAAFPDALARPEPPAWLAALPTT